MMRAAQHTARLGPPRLVLVAGMQKAGTGWLFHIVDTLLAGCGGHGAYGVRDAFALTGVLTGQNCNIGTPRLARLAALVPALRAGRRFAIKTHRGPNLWTGALERAGVLKSIYVWRDPRDVALSAFAHGERERAAGITGNFGRLRTLDMAIDYAAHLLPVWRAWQRNPRALRLRYEDLRADLPGALERLAGHLGVAPAAALRAEILARYAADQPDPATRAALHFDRAGSGRWRAAMNAAQQAHCARRFGPWLEAMGYASD